MNTKTTRITPEQVDGQMALCQKIHAYWQSQGITNGMGDGTFGVNSICNRAQMVTFLYRSYNK